MNLLPPPGSPAGSAPSRRGRAAATFLVAAALAAVSPALQAQKGPDQPAAAEESFKPQSGQAGKDVIWVPTPDEIVAALLDMAQVKAGDIHYDLGSGDGKIVIAAARRGAVSTGVEFNPDMVGLSRRNAQRAGVTTARFVQGDIFETDFSRADVVTLYLLPGLNLRLRPTLLDMKPGTRVASHQFSMGDWEPDEKRTINGRDALFWVVPAKVAGTWTANIPNAGVPLTLTFTQTFQQVTGSANWGASPARLGDVTLRGARIRFAVTDTTGTTHQIEAVAAGDGRLTGSVSNPAGQRQPFTANRKPS